MQPSVLYGPYCALASLLAVAGFAKFVRPHETAKAFERLLSLKTTKSLNRTGIASAVAVIRGLSVAEIVIGCLGLLRPTMLDALAVSLSYAGFSLLILVAIWKAIPLATCGCFGEPDTPPTVLHVILTFAASILAGIVAAEPGGSSLGRVFSLPVFDSVQWVIATGTVTYLIYVALGAFARLQGIMADAEPSEI